MSNIFRLSALAILTMLAPLRVSAQTAPTQYVEQSIEATSRTVLMGAAVGSMTVSGCPACPSRTLTLASNSKFYLGGVELTFVELKQAMSTTPLLFMTIHYRAEDNSVTRVTATAATPTP
jgi:hypothetical protein